MLTDEEVRKNAEVKETYRKMHVFQTVDFVRQKVGTDNVPHGWLSEFRIV